jgi:hypothetical protein
MSAEPVAATVTATEALPEAEEKKIEASEAPSQAEPAPTIFEPVKTEPSEAPAQVEATEAPVVVPITPETVTKVEKQEENAEPASKQESTSVSEPPAPAPVPAAASEKDPEILSTPNAKLFADLPAIIKEAEHNEIWGVELKDASHVPTTIVIEKFLRANAKDVAKAKAQLIQALKWRKKVDPRKLLTESVFDSKKFEGLGYVTVYPETETHEKEIVTWNIYGSVKDFQETFGNVEE